MSRGRREPSAIACPFPGDCSGPESRSEERKTTAQAEEDRATKTPGSPRNEPRSGRRGGPSLTLPVFLVTLLLVASPATAKPPTLSGLFPAGAARGETAIITASGSFDHWPARGWVDGKDVEIEANAEKGKLSIRVAADAEPGVRWVRLYDEEGATNLRPFVIGSLPEVAEVEPNDSPKAPQRIEATSATVNGRLAKRGDVDGFALTLARGQTLVADLEASRHLGSPMDAVLQIVSANGFVLAQNDDTVGRDPRIVFEAPADGTFLVRLFAFPATPDSSIRFAGGEDFVYRLTLTTGGFLDLAFPLAVSRDGSTPVAAVGPNIPDAAKLRAEPTSDDGSDFVRVSHPLLAGTAEVRRVALAAVEIEPDDPAHPQEMPARGVLSGRIDPPGDRDTFRVTLKKGEKRVFRVESQALGLPLDPVLRLIDAGGKTLAESDDAGKGRDPSLAFTAPADGDYRLVVRDLHGRGGPRFAYLLHAPSPEPDFSLTLAADRFDLTPGGTTKVVVTVDRKDGFSGAIEVSAPDLPEGVTADPATSRPGDATAKSVTLELRADGCSHPGPFRLLGRPAEGSSPPRAALAPISGFEAKTDHPWLTIRPEPQPTKR